MNKILSKSILGLLAFTALTVICTSSCKKKPTTDDPVTPVKTLTKSFLYDKTWRNKGNTVSHIFNSDGTYATLGTWKWLNDSDSMRVDNKTGPDYTLYFDWSTEHECAIRISKNSGSTLYKDYKW